jgi:hypothetical protein
MLREVPLLELPRAVADLDHRQIELRQPRTRFTTADGEGCAPS